MNTDFDFLLQDAWQQQEGGEMDIPWQGLPIGTPAAADDNDSLHSFSSLMGNNSNNSSSSSVQHIAQHPSSLSRSHDSSCLSDQHAGPTSIIMTSGARKNKDEFLCSPTPMDVETHSSPSFRLDPTSGSVAASELNNICSSSSSSLEPWPLVDMTIIHRLDEATHLHMLKLRLGEADLVQTVVETFGSSQINKKKKPNSNHRGVASASVHVARTAAWHAKYRELVQYYHQHGHCNVPSSYTANPSLSHWVKRQRSNWKQYRGGNHHKSSSSSLDQERIDLLNRIGFVWDMYKDAWESKYQLLLDYQREFGHTNVPMSVDTDPLHSKYAGLGVWVKSQRRHYQLLQRYGYAKSNLTPERVMQLNAIHFDWDRRPRGGEVCLVKLGV